MSARDRKAIEYARDRLAAVMLVLAQMETHGSALQRTYAPDLREALALGDVKIKCECDVCEERARRASSDG